VKPEARFPWLYFVLAFAITWLIWSPGLMATWGWFELPLPFLVFFFLGTWGPFLAAVIVLYREGGWEAVKAFLRRGLDWRIGWRWVAVIIGIPLLVSALPLGVHLLLGGPPPAATLLTTPLMIVPVVATYFLTGGGNEEWGWRGFALDRLQSARTGLGWHPLVAAVGLGVIWGLWHLPLFFIEYTAQYHEPLWLFILAAPAVSILHSWVYNGSGGKLVAAWLFHAAIGGAWEVFPLAQPDVPGYERVFVLAMVASIIVAVVVAITRPSFALESDKS